MMTSKEYWQTRPEAVTEIVIQGGKSVSEMTTEELMDMFRDAIWNDHGTTKAFILFYADLDADLYKAIQEKYPEYVL